jgi:hypothetical protein
VGQGDVVGVRDQDRRDGRARLGHPVLEREELLDLGAADGQLVRGLLVHRRLHLGRHRAAAARVEEDPGRRRGQRAADRVDLLGIRHERADHARMIRAG